MVTFLPETDFRKYCYSSTPIMSCDAKEFVCASCNFSTRDRKDWRRHIGSKKHRAVVMGGASGYVCDDCGKSYKYASGMSRHRKTCASRLKRVMPDEIEAMAVEKAQARHIKELQGMIHQLTETNRKAIEALSPKASNVYNTTNKMTVNVFLNEKCKGAMDLNEFLESMVISASDLDYTRENGYVKGISNIFVKHLEDLGPLERPIHCVDAKRLQFYVKDEGEWNRDGDEKMNDSIHRVSSKQIQRIKEWERAHPDWVVSEDGVEEYLATVRSVMGGCDGRTEHCVDDIKRQLGANVSLRPVDLAVLCTADNSSTSK